MFDLLSGNGTSLGVLEFSHRTLRRWTSHDLKQAGTLADHVADDLAGAVAIIAGLAGKE